MSVFKERSLALKDSRNKNGDQSKIMKTRSDFKWCKVACKRKIEINFNSMLEDGELKTNSKQS